MNILTDWAKNIIYYVLFVKLLTTLIPNGNMSKYIKLFSGILLMLVLAEPIMSLNRLDEKVLKNFINYEMVIAQDSFTSQINTYNNVNDTLAINIYKKKVEAHICQIVETENVDIISLEVIIEDKQGVQFGELIAINLCVTPKSSNKIVRHNKIEISSKSPLNDNELTAEDIILQKNIKIALHGFYNIPTDNMNISIE